MRHHTHRIFCILLGVCLWFLTSCVSSDFLPPQDGDHRLLGTTRFLLDDPRGLVIQAWYPATDFGSGRIDPIIQLEQGEAYFKPFPISREQLENRLISSSYVDARVEEGPHPVIIFDHGYEGFEKQNMSQMEELASHGYIVFAVNHPGESFVTLYPDGSVQTIDSDRYPSLRGRTGRERRYRRDLTTTYFDLFREQKDDGVVVASMRQFSSYAHVRLMELPIRERTQDIVNLLHQLSQLNEEGQFAGTLDLDRVGLYGHSMGGNVCIDVASLENLPVNLRAIANLDGPYLLFPQAPIRIPKVPLLMAYSTGSYTGAFDVNLSECNDWILRASDETDLRVIFHGSTHANFSDLTYIEILRDRITGDIDGHDMGMALEKLLVAWFDEHLKDIPMDFNQLKASYPLWEMDFR
ncbi:MAG: hypothetical protein MI717_13360 [Spirochaetales bacterium]|nr:hypothetical protein [Spirochaetales bacterium]